MKYQHVESVEEQITSKIRDILWNYFFEKIHDSIPKNIKNVVDFKVRSVDECIELSVGRPVSNVLEPIAYIL